MAKAEKKILRVGIIQGGKIIEERLIRRREPVTIGQSPKNSFYIPISKLPRKLTLFDVEQDTYNLCFDKQMQGRVSFQGKVQTLNELTSDPSVNRRSGVNFLPLDEKSRGKVVLGDITLLFQFVTPPPVVPKPQLPASAKGGLGQAIMAEYHFLLAIIVSLFLQGGFIVMSKVFYEPEDKVQKARRFISQALKVDVQFDEKEEEKDDPEEKSDEEKEDDEIAAEPEPEPPPMVKPPPPKKKAPKKPKAEKKTQKRAGPKDLEALKRRRRAKIRNSTILKHITAAGPGGNAGPDALRAGHANRLKSAFDTGGITVGKPGDVAGFRGGPKLSGKSAKLRVANLSKKERGSGRLKTGKVKKAGKKKETKVRLRIGLRGGRKSGGIGKLDGSQVTRVFRRRARAFRSCYERRLKVNPNLKGKLVLRFTIGTAGRITSIRVASNSTGDSAVGSCIRGKVRGWRFTPPENGSVTFTYPIVLSKG